MFNTFNDNVKAPWKEIVNYLYIYIYKFTYFLNLKFYKYILSIKCLLTFDACL